MPVYLIELKLKSHHDLILDMMQLTFMTSMLKQVALGTCSSNVLETCDKHYTLSIKMAI